MKAASEESFKKTQKEVHHEEQKTVAILSVDGLSDHLIFLASLILYGAIHLKRPHSTSQAER